MRRVLVGFLLLLGCATNERVAALDGRVARLEAAAQFEARLAKVEARAASLDSTIEAERALEGRAAASSQRAEALRVELAGVERRLARLENRSEPSFEPRAATASHADAPTRKEAWMAPRGPWSEWNRSVAQELWKLYAKGDPSGAVLKEPDAQGQPWAPRNPGKTGLGLQDLLDHELERTRFLSSSGATVDLREYKEKKKAVVLVILRGFDPEGGVCIACSTQTLALAQNAEEFEKRGAEVLLVYPGKAETIDKFIDSVRDLQANDRPLPLQILLDVDLAAVKELRIEGRLAKPTSLVIDKQGIVRFAHVGRNKTDRPTVPQLLEVVEGLGKP